MKGKLHRYSKLLGIDERHDAGSLNPEAADEIVNMSWDPRGAWREAGGFRPILDPVLVEEVETPAFDGLGKVETLFWFQQHGRRQWLIFEAQPTVGAATVTLFHFQGRGRTWTAIETGRMYQDMPWSRTQYLSIGGWMYYINGYDRPNRWNGDRIERIGFDQRPPILDVREVSNRTDYSYHTQTSHYTAGVGGAHPNSPYQLGVGTYVDTPAGGAGVSKEYWRYGYALTWINDLGQESPPSDVAWATGINQMHPDADALTDPDDGKRYVQIHVSDAPPSWAKGMRLYRTRNLWGGQFDVVGDPVMYLHSEYPVAAGRNILDGRSDEELGIELDRKSLGLFPTGAYLMAFFKNTLFLATNEGVRYSAPLRPEQFPEDNRLDVGTSAGNRVTGFYATRNALVVTTRRGVYLVKGIPPDFVAETLTEDSGGSGPKCMVEVPGMGVFIAHESGCYMLVGTLEDDSQETQVIPLSDPLLRRTWERKVNHAALVAAHVEVYHEDRECWIDVPQHGQGRPTLGLVFHYEIQQWSTRDGYPMSAKMELRDHRSILVLGSHDETNHPGIHVYTRGAADLDGDTLTAKYRSVPINWGDLYGRQRMYHVHAYMWDYGRDVTVTHERDRLLADARDSAYPRSDVHPARDERNQTEAADVWDTALWGTGLIWYDYRPVEVKASAPSNFGVWEYQWTLQCSRILLVSAAITIAIPDRVAKIPQIESTLTQPPRR